MPVIPTKVRCKIGRSLSYAVGAEAISAALEGVPQYEQFTICFHRLYQRLKDRGKPYDILVVNYSGKNRTPSGEDEWTVSVKPVPSGRKHEIRTLLEVEAFPKIRKWLVNRAGLESRHEAQSISVIYDDCSDALKVEEYRVAGEAHTV